MFGIKKKNANMSPKVLKGAMLDLWTAFKMVMTTLPTMQCVS